MREVSLDVTLEQIKEALERGDVQSAINVIRVNHPADMADLFEELGDEAKETLLPALEPVDSADILQELSDAQAAELAEGLPDEALARIVDEMEPDEAADLLGDLQAERAQAILSELEDPDEVRPLLLHPDETAGGLMTSDFMALRRRMTVQDAIEMLRHWHPGAESIYYLYVVDSEGRLCGVVSLRELVIAQPATRIGQIMNPNVISVGQDIDQEEVARVLSHYDLLALPVVDPSSRLIGVVTVDDVIDVIEQEASEDIQRLGGAEPLDRPYLETSPFAIVRKRIGWLLLLFITATLTGSVIRLFQNEMEAAVALVIFIPLLIGTGGNAGSQTTATIIRSLATGDIDPGRVLSVWWHEAKVGFLLGIGMGLFGYLRAVTWDVSLGIGVVVAVSTVCIVLWATAVGALLPLIAAKLGIDPALISGPVMSTLVDATGLLIYFSIARVVLQL